MIIWIGKINKGTSAIFFIDQNKSRKIITLESYGVRNVVLESGKKIVLIRTDSFVTLQSMSNCGLFAVILAVVEYVFIFFFCSISCSSGFSIFHSDYNPIVHLLQYIEPNY